MPCDINKISDAIDELLDRPKWSQREFAFYQMLIVKVKQYQNFLPKSIDPAHPIKNITDDIAEIMQNIREQTWFKSSHNQGTILDLIQNMTIPKCLHQGSPRDLNYHYRLVLALKPSISLVMDVARDSRSTSSPPHHLRLYYESGRNKGHIAAFTPGIGKKKGHTLPEYTILDRIFPSLKRHEIICLAIELLMYYDIDYVMSKLPIGNNYPITLTQLMNGITNVETKNEYL